VAKSGNSESVVSESDMPAGIPEPVGDNLFGSSDEDPFGPSNTDSLDLENSGSSDSESESNATDSGSDHTAAQSPAPMRDANPAKESHLLRGHVRDIAEMVIRQSRLEEHLKKIGGEELDELHNVEELISSAAEFDKENPEGTLDDFLAQVSLVSDADHMEGAGGAITLMTLHAAKGLEFPVVAMIGMEEGILPHSRSRGDMKQLEEERRLCFVGITRAQEQIILSKAARRTIRGISERTIPSPFLHEMPVEELEVTDRTGVESYSTYGRPHGSPPAQRRREDALDNSSSQIRGGQFSHLRRGQIVRHPQFGIGRIREIEEMGEQRTRAIVQFNQVGEKRLILEVARLEVVD
jgi:DNA helicase-2/ATP-dependent DNA helicase PcrA